VARALGSEQGVNIPAQGEVEVTLPRSTARRGRPRGASTEVSRLREQVAQLQREVAQLRRNNADTPSVATRGNATPILPSPDLAQLQGRIETLEKDLRDTRKKRQSSVIKCNKLEAKCKAQHDELENLRNRERDVTHADKARDRQIAHTQRQHSQVANQVTQIQSSLAKANAEKVRLRKNVKESKATAEAAAALEMQATLEIKAAKEDKRALQKRLVRAQGKAAQGTTPKLRSCSVTDFNQKTPEARRKASERDRKMWSELLKGDQRLDGLVSVLKSQGRLDELFNVKELYEMHIGKVNDIMRMIEEEHYGVDFGLFLHYEMSLPLHKILRITHAGSHHYDKVEDMYVRKVILCSGYSLKVPRLGPPRNVLEPVMRKLEDSLGVETREDGRVAFLEFDKALADIVNEDPGGGGMPPLEEFEGGKRRFPVVFSYLLRRDWLRQLAVEDRRPAQPLQARLGGAVASAWDWVPLRQPRGRAEGDQRDQPGADSRGHPSRPEWHDDAREAPEWQDGPYLPRGARHARHGRPAEVGESCGLRLVLVLSR